MSGSPIRLRLPSACPKLEARRPASQKGAEGDKWPELPVDFHTFVECDHLMKARTILWPEVIRYGQEMNSGKYVEAVLTGGIGVAKTTLAIYSQAFQLYVLYCLDQPHKQFDLDPASEILMVFQSINKNLAMDVDYRRFRNIVEAAPFFRVRFPFSRDRLSEMWRSRTTSRSSRAAERIQRRSARTSSVASSTKSTS